MQYAIDQMHAFRKHVFCRGWFSGLASPLGRISVIVGNRQFAPHIVQVDRADVGAAFGPGAEKWGFEFSCRVDPDAFDWYGSVSLLFHDGENELRVDDPAQSAGSMYRTEAADAELEFFRLMSEATSPNVLEIGSRMRSGNVKTGLPEDANYVGLDIVGGPNVHVVADAHFMASKLPRNHFDFVFSISTFEHLLMPWKVAVELNTVMRVGGLAFIHSHQTWPVHDAPWDFYRFSKFGWHGIFNQFTGFEMVRSAHGEPATVLSQAQINNPATFLEHETGYLLSVCLIRKVSSCSLKWEADPSSIMATAYPG